MSLRDELIPRVQRPFPDGKYPVNLSLYSFLSFGWISPLMVTGYKRPLEEADVFQVHPDDRSGGIATRLRGRFELVKPSLLRALAQEWWKETIKAGLWKTVNDGSQFAGPVFMSWILGGLTTFTTQHLFLLAVGMYLSQIIGGLGEAQYFQTGMRVGMQLRASLMALIFQKSLRLSSHSRMHGVSGGKLTNMISSDCESLQSFCEVMHVLWSAPLRIVTSMVLLYYLLGLAAICGAAVLVAMIPLQKYLVTKMTRRVKAAQQFTDDRLKVVSEVFQSVQLVKCYTWEDAFRTRVTELRERELGELYKYSLIRAVNSFLISAVPVVVAVVSFAAYSLLPLGNAPLTAVQAFTALSLFQVLRFPLMQLPSVVNSLGACRVSLDRISQFLTLPETELAISQSSSSTELIAITNALFQWPNSPFSLTVPHLAIGPKDLLVVVGHTASGKSSLLQALLGHFPIVSGSITASTAVLSQGSAYCPQSPWIFSGSVRDNVIFGSSVVDESRYEKSIKAVGFKEDLKWMPDGDRTEIGERGVNLSGGQKQRLSLARAVYAETELVLLDDPLSALDAAVAVEVYRSAIAGAMADRGRVLVTNRLEAVIPSIGEFRPKFVHINRNGSVSPVSSFEQLMAGSDEFRSLVHKITSEATHTTTGSTPAESGRATPEDGVGDEKNRVASVVVTPKTNFAISKKVEKGAEIISKEGRTTGALSTDVVKTYTNAMRWFLVIVAMYVLTEVSRVLASVWLSRWTAKPTDAQPVDLVAKEEEMSYYLWIYVVLSGLQLMFLLSGQLLISTSANAASRGLHARMFERLLVAPMAFFQSTPMGRILNRFSKDVGDMDRNLPMALAMTLTVSLTLVGTVVVLGLTASYTVLAFLPLMVAFYYIQEYYRSTSRELKRMDSISRSPIYSHFQQIQDGIATVLAFRKEDTERVENTKLIDNHIRFNLAQMSINRWLGIRLEFYGGALVLVAALFIVAERDVVSPGVAGLAISTALQVTGALGGIVRIGAMLENSFNSVERINEYSEVETERVEGATGVAPPARWPATGGVAFKNVVAMYHSSSVPVLKSVSFTIRGGQKVGIIGRTGAGKSSLVMALFRIVEPCEGTVEIDGIDVSKISLRALRSVLGIIPQDPLVFEGTIRSNIDPFGMYRDDAIRAALQAAHLPESLALDTPIVAGGKNLSAGQRQQVCLARVVLRRPKILALDEATSSLDAETDHNVVDTIKQEFAGATVITIAHRLHTIVESDVLIALDNGRIAEMGSPAELMEKANGLFASLVQETGSQTAKHLKARIRASRS